MGEYAWIPVMVVIVSYTSWCTTKARKRGRKQWMGNVGRPPRDLFADQRVNRVANLIHEWAWVGLLVVLAGFCLLAVGEIGWYVVGLGCAMVLANVVVRPHLYANAELDPKYEAEAQQSLA